MIPQPPPGQGPVDPRGAFSPPSPPSESPAASAGGPQATPQPESPQRPASPAQSQLPPQPSFGYGAYGSYPQAPYPPMMQAQTPPTQFPPMGMGPGMRPGMPPGGFGPGTGMGMGMGGQPPRRGGAGRVIFMTFLILLLAFSVLLNLVLIAGSVGGSSSTLQHTVQSGKGNEKIAIVPLKGIIDPNASAQFDKFMDQAEADKAVKAIVIEIDSPGGTVTASDEIYNRIKTFKAKKSVPIVVSMASLATSGGYYAACGADHVVAQPTTFTGNIGVLMPRYNFSKLMEKYGVEETTIVSSGAPFKNAGSNFRPENAEEKAYMQELADAAFDQFKKVVGQGRSSKLKATVDVIANGKVYTAEDALTLGLIDQIGYLEDAQNVAKAQAGLTNPTVVKYHDPPSLMDLFVSSNNTGVTGLTFGRAARAGGQGSVNITVDSSLLHELSTPRPLYLWRGE